MKLIKLGNSHFPSCNFAYSKIEYSIMRSLRNLWICFCFLAIFPHYPDRVNNFLPLSFLKSSASCLSVTISFMLTTLRCLSCRRILISLMAVMGKPSFSLSKRTFFKATNSPVELKRTFIKISHNEMMFTFNTRHLSTTVDVHVIFAHLCLCPWPCILGHRSLPL